MFDILRCVSASLLTLTFSALPAAGQQPPPAPVVVADVAELTIRSGQTFVATVQPSKRAVIGSAVDGRVVEFPVELGERVESGQPLGQLLTETVSLELAAAEAEFELRSSELAELENGTRLEDVNRAKAQHRAAETALVLSEKRLARIQRLKNTSTASEDQLDEAVASVDNAKAMLDERRAMMELAVAGPRKEQIAQARARVKIQQAIVDKLKDQIKKYTIRSRFDAFVVTEHTEVGQWLNRGDLVAEIVALDEVDVVASVLETHIPYILNGTSARIEVPALPDQLFVGKVQAVVPQGDERSRTFPVRIRVKNIIKADKPLLNAGMLARVVLPTGPSRARLMVPKDAVVLGGAGPRVYVVQADGKQQLIATPVSVRLGTAKDALVEVVGDLASGQRVVIRGNERLRPGQNVNVIQTITSESLLSNSKS
ncbi:MAG: efflux RND transporter periplasmic adaptor subunit [Fuerstiella sp.]